MQQLNPPNAHRQAICLTHTKSHLEHAQYLSTCNRSAGAKANTQADKQNYRSLALILGAPASSSTSALLKANFAYGEAWPPKRYTPFRSPWLVQIASCRLWHPLACVTTSSNKNQFAAYQSQQCCCRCIHHVCAAAGLEHMFDKLPLAKLGTAAVYSCGKLALLDVSGCDRNVHEMILPNEMASATWKAPSLLAKMHCM